MCVVYNQDALLKGGAQGWFCVFCFGNFVVEDVPRSNRLIDDMIVKVGQDQHVSSRNIGNRLHGSVLNDLEKIGHKNSTMFGCYVSRRRGVHSTVFPSAKLSRNVTKLSGHF